VKVLPEVTAYAADRRDVALANTTKPPYPQVPEEGLSRITGDTLREVTTYVGNKNLGEIAKLLETDAHGSETADVDGDVDAEDEDVSEMFQLQTLHPLKETITDRTVTALAPKLPFSIGSKVVHKIKGEAYGVGIILRRDAEYLTVEFPTAHKTMPMMTETASKYLRPVDDLANPQGHPENTLNMNETVSQLVAAASKTAVSKLSLETQVETWLDLGRYEKAHPEYLAALSKALPLIKRAPSLEAAVAAVQREMGGRSA
jgi:hypothetical protein